MSNQPSSTPLSVLDAALPREPSAPPPSEGKLLALYFNPQLSDPECAEAAGMKLRDFIAWSRSPEITSQIDDIRAWSLTRARILADSSAHRAIQLLTRSLDPDDFGITGRDPTPATCERRFESARKAAIALIDLTALQPDQAAPRLAPPSRRRTLAAPKLRAALQPHPANTHDPYRSPHPSPSPALLPARPTRALLMPPTSSNAAAPKPQAETIKETLISIVIAFALAFVFRGFVVEAFVIPTGSMAPTLMGAHMRFTSPSTGYSWPVGPWESVGQNEYASVQGAGRAAGGAGGFDSITVHDPMSGDLLDKRSVPLQSGDRILVLKYLYSIFDPQRFDVIVFKNPFEPGVNYIKRLIGLPGEEIALVDGDVFTRKPAESAAAPNSNSWLEPGWTIARKTTLQQQVAWQPIFDSGFSPLESSTFNRPWNIAPTDAGAWKMDPRVYTFDSAAVKNTNKRAELFFDQSRQRFAPMNYAGVERGEKWTLDDRYAYDETPVGGRGNWFPETFQLEPRYPAGDLRVRAGVEPTAEGLTVEAIIRARGHEFQAFIEGSTAKLRIREMAGEMGVFGAWKDVQSASITPLRSGHVTNIELWHADQSLQLWIDGDLVARHDYDWSPSERILHATGRALDQVLMDPRGERANPLSNPAIYQARKPDVRWAFSGAGAKLYRVGIDRDLYYQPASKRNERNEPVKPGLGVSPAAPLRLNADQFFACGDNSPASLDGRLWTSIDPWVAHEFDNTIGVVPRELLLGRAFFVYWPSLIKGSKGIPVPDFGRMRFIW